MTPAFDTNAYWLERGKTYIGEQARLAKQFYRDQEQFFCDTVADFKPTRILEIGCGFGRLTKRLGEIGHVFASDLSDDQVSAARARCPEASIIQHDVLGAYELPTADVAVACEVFLHLPNPGHAISKLLKAALIVVHDYDPAQKPRDSTGPHCFSHDYGRIYSDLGLSFLRKIRGEHGLMVVRRA